MKISVITPSYNQVKYLEQTILSVLDQSYSNFEYIIIDGGSSDGSVKIIKKYQKYLTYWISEKDNGQSHAINKGFKRVTGDIVGWIGSDDYYEPDCFLKVVEAFQKDEAIGVVYGDNNLVDENNNILKVYSIPDISADKLLKGNPNVVQPGSFYRRIFLNKVGLLDESLKYVMDYDLWVRLGKISKIYHISKILANFRLHPESKTEMQKVFFAKEIFRVKSRYGIKKLSWGNRIVLYRFLRDKLRF